MDATCRAPRWLRGLALALCLSAAPAFGQGAPAPAGPGAGVILLPPRPPSGTSGPAGTGLLPPVPLPAGPAPFPQPCVPVPPPPPWEIVPPPPGPPEPGPLPVPESKFDYTYLPGGDPQLEMHDIEWKTSLVVPLDVVDTPLVLTPGLGVHFWEGPPRGRVPPAPHLPPTLYDAYLEFGWSPRLARWLFTDLAVSTGLYSDMKDFDGALQLRGRAVAIVAFSPEFQLAGGLAYVNRLKTRVLPVGGFLWNPTDDIKLRVVFPQPKLAYRVAVVDDAQWWAYLGGEFGGGRWAIQRDGGGDKIDYTDWRVLLGLECVGNLAVRGYVETGYVFKREVRFRGNVSDPPDFEPGNTWLVRAGVRY